MGQTNFYFGKFHFQQLSTLWDFDEEVESSRKELIRNRLVDYVNESDVIYREPDGYWRFGKCKETEGMIIGKLGKIFTEERTTWDDESEDYITFEEEVEVADVSFFIADPQSEGIAFNRKLHTGSEKFTEAFATGYNDYYDLADGLTIELQRTGGDKHYSEILQDARRVYSVDFDLVPVNPSADEEMEILDDHIKEMNAEEMGFDAESGEGLNYEEDFIRSAFAMSDDGGYGDYTIRFEKDGEKETYNSRGDHATTELEEPEELDDLKTIAEKLLTRLQQLLSQNDE